MCRVIAKSTLITVLINFFMVNFIFGQSVRTEQHIRLENPADKSKYILLAAPTSLSTINTFQFPSVAGTSGQVLTSTSDGGMVWSTPSVSGSSVPSGSIMMYAGSSAPDGWALCDGSAINRTTYSALFTAISTTYGSGDGSTTFNLPDMRGRYGLGADNMGGNTAGIVLAAQADILGGTSGAETHQIQISEMPNHTHIVRARNLNGSNDPTNRIFGYANSMYATNTPNRTMNEETLSNTGGGQSHNNMPPYITLNYIIKL